MHSSFRSRLMAIIDDTPWILVGLGAASLVVYLAINFVLPQSAGYMTHPRAALIPRFFFWSTLVRLPVPRPDTAAATASLVTITSAVALVCYASAVWISQRVAAGPRNARIVLGFAVLFYLSSTLTLPTFNGDLYMYILYARVANVYHANPYVMPPATFANDPWLQLGDWTRTVLPHGPVWAHLSIIWQRLNGDGVVQNVLAFRGLLLAFNLANVALLWRIVGRLKPTFRLTGLVCYAWNPIIVVDGQQHLDTVMVFFLLLGVYLCLDRRDWLAVGSVTLSVLTKFITAPLLMVYLIFLWRHRSFRFMALAAALAGGLALLTFLPFAQGLLGNARDPSVSAATAPMGSAPTVVMTARAIFLPGFLTVTLWVAWRASGTILDMLRGWAIIMLWFAVFLMPHEFAWYMSTLIGIASVAGSRRIGWLTVAVSASAFLTSMLGAIAHDATAPPALVSPQLFRLIWWGPLAVAFGWAGWSYLSGSGARAWERTRKLAGSYRRSAAG